MRKFSSTEFSENKLESATLTFTHKMKNKNQRHSDGRVERKLLRN